MISEWVNIQKVASSDAGIDSYKDMVKGQFPFPLHLTVQFELRIQSGNTLNLTHRLINIIRTLTEKYKNTSS